MTLRALLERTQAHAADFLEGLDDRTTQNLCYWMARAWAIHLNLLRV